MASAPDNSSQLIDNFIDLIWLEKGLSTNTLSAYRQDMPDQVEQYVKSFQDQNLTSSSINRKISSLKHLYLFLHKKKLVQSNPIANFSGPKNIRPLPKSMSQLDVESLIQAPDCTNFIGLRDRAMLELLYATGVRISELINLQYTNIDTTVCN